MEENTSGQIFVLDIGTRSVVGLAGHKEGELFVVEAWAAEPHPRRAMIDGQIEDIEQVARVAAAVKQRIEGALGTTFTRVGVAAAGRALKTCRASASMELPATVPINAQTVFALENAAINLAREELDAQDSDATYYCAGHSAVRYTLDGYPFSTILGHKASLAEVEVIATFLPSEVVESLRLCMDLLGLDIDTLTLEPIAAMRAVIPQDLRLLNLALVDIGAGTSDIALSNDGTVAGYTMATVAGDEVTESIIRKYLVDFNTAERLKMALEQGGPFAYTDILGFEHEADAEDLTETIHPAVETLAHVIAERIVEANGSAPAAVFLVGGGSRTPGLCQLLADKLDLPHNRVALAGTHFSGTLLNEDSGLDGPEYATPVGIALTTADAAEVEGAAVTINGRRVRLFTLAATGVMDALLLGGYTYSDLMGRNGRPLTFTLNGVRTVVRGGPYTAAELAVNGKAASLATPVEDGDAIDIVTATSGEDATAFIADYAQGERPIRVSLNGKVYLAGLIAKINEAVATPDTPILEQDAVELYLIRSVGELCEAAGLALPGLAITVNGEAAAPSRRLHDADVIVADAGAAGQAVTASVAPQETAPAPTPAPQPQPVAFAPASSATPSPAPAPVPQAPLLQPEEPSALPTSLQPVVGLPTAAQAPIEASQTAPVDASVPTQAAVPAAAPLSPPPVAQPVPPLASFGAPHIPAGPQQPTPASKPLPKPTAVAPMPPARPAGAPASAKVEAPSPIGVQAAPAPAATAPMPPAAAASKESLPTSSTKESKPEKPPTFTEAPAETPAPAARSLRIQLNGKTVVLPPKPGGEPHRLFDMLALVDIDPANPKGLIRVRVNGADVPYMEQLLNGDEVEIGWED